MCLIIYDVSVGRIAIFACLIAVASAQTTAETNHLRLSASSSANRVHPGQQVALTLDIELKPACDDRMCYVPKTVPLKWTLQVQ
jgi:hypothetical protein